MGIFFFGNIVCQYVCRKKETTVCTHTYTHTHIHFVNIMMLYFQNTNNSYGYITM